MGNFYYATPSFRSRRSGDGPVLEELDRMYNQNKSSSHGLSGRVGEEPMQNQTFLYIFRIKNSWALKNRHNKQFNQVITKFRIICVHPEQIENRFLFSL